MHAAEPGISFCTPCQTMRVQQCAQVGANVWIAHSKLSKVWDLPPIVIWNVLS
jgi:hypothetical protein